MGFHSEPIDFQPLNLIETEIDQEHLPRSEMEVEDRSKIRDKENSKQLVSELKQLITDFTTGTQAQQG